MCRHAFLFGGSSGGVQMLLASHLCMAPSLCRHAYLGGGVQTSAAAESGGAACGAGRSRHTGAQEVTCTGCGGKVCRIGELFGDILAHKRLHALAEEARSAK